MKFLSPTKRQTRRQRHAIFSRSIYSSIQFEPKGGEGGLGCLGGDQEAGQSKPDGGDEEQDGEDDHQAVEHEDTGEERGEQQSWRKKRGNISLI